MLERPRPQALWVQSISRTHEQLLRLLDDDLTAVQTEDGYLVLNLRPLVIQLGDEVAVAGRLAERLPESSGGIRLMEADQLETAQDLTQLLKSLGTFLFIVPLLLAALALWLAAGRRRVILRSLGFGLVLAGVLVLVVRSLGGSYVVDNLVPNEAGRPAVADAWDILTRLLADGGWFLILFGAAGLLGVWITGESRPATGARRSLAPYLARPEYAFGAAAALLLLLVWWAPLVQFRRGLAVLAMADRARDRGRGSSPHHRPRVSYADRGLSEANDGPAAGVSAPTRARASSFSTTLSIVKLAASCRGGNSLNVSRNCVAMAVAARTM